MEHDFDAQKAETLSAFADIDTAQDVPDTADVDFFFVPRDDAADWRPLADRLTREGYDCEWVDGTAGDEEAEPDEDPYLVATLPDQPLSAQSVWMAEEHATRIALDHGFAPDGWGFES